MLKRVFYLRLIIVEILKFVRECMCQGRCETVSVFVHSLLMFFSNVFIKIEIGVEIHKEKFNP